MGLFAESRKTRTSAIVKPQAVSEPAAPSQPVQKLPTLAELNKVEPVQRILPNLIPQSMAEKYGVIPQPQPAPVGKTTPFALLPAQGAVEGFAKLPGQVESAARDVISPTIVGLAKSVFDRSRQPAGLNLPQAQPETRETIQARMKAETERQLAAKAQGVAPATRLPDISRQNAQQVGEAAIAGTRKIIGTPDMSTEAARTAYSAGAMVPQMLPYFAPGIGQVAGPIIGAGSGAQEALAQGATPEQAQRYGLAQGAVLAATQGMGVPGKISGIVAGKVSSTVGKALLGLAKTAAEEGVQEGIEYIVGNIAASATFDKDRKIIVPSELREAMTTGALLGALGGGVTEGAAGLVRSAATAGQRKAATALAKAMSDYEAAQQKLAAPAEAVVEPEDAPVAQEAPDYATPAARSAAQQARSAQARKAEMDAAAEAVMKAAVEYAESKGVASQERSTQNKNALLDMDPTEAEAVVGAIVNDNFDAIKAAIMADRQHEYNEAYVEWDQTVNDFDERGSTPESRAAWRKSIEPVLERYQQAEAAMNTPITPDILIREMKYGVAPDAAYNVVSSVMRAAEPEPEPVVEPPAPVQPKRQFVPSSARTVVPGAKVEPTAAPTSEAPDEGVTPDLQYFGNIEPGTMVGAGAQQESKTSQNIRADRVGNEAVTRAFEADPITYNELTKTQVMDAVNKKMESYDGTIQNLDKLYDSWAERMQGDGQTDVSDIPLVRVLANEYTRLGRNDKAEQAYAIAAEAGLTYGRFVNAFKYIYDAADPNVVAKAAEKIADKINAEGEKKYGKKWKPLEIEKDESAALVGVMDNRKQAMKLADNALDAASTPQQKQEALDAMGKIIKDPVVLQQIADAINKGVDADGRKSVIDAIDKDFNDQRIKIMDDITTRWATIVPSTAFEKWNYWRRFAMLTSPKTHIRNITSNIARSGLEVAKDAVATGLERVTFVPKDTRQHAFAWEIKPEVWKTTDAAWESVRDELTHAIKYEVSTLKGLEGKTAPLGKAMNEVSSALMNSLEKEDKPFMYFAFRSSLAQQMAARGVTDPTPAMIEKAKNVSLEVTYKLKNSLSEAVMGAKEKGGLVGAALEALVPFVRTPAAIAKTAAEFTPGIGAIQMARDVKSGKITNRAQAIDSISKQIVGTALLSLGYAMAKAGLAFGEDEKSKKAKAIQEMGGGRQKFSVKLPGKEWTYTIDFMQPTATPFMIGVQMYQAMNDKGVAALPQAVASAGMSAVDTFFDQSMLAGVNNFFKTEDKGEAFLNMITDYVAQGIPTIYTQIVQQIAGTERVTYDSNMTTGEKIMAKFKGKAVPWALDEKVDAFGNVKPRNPLNTLVSPGFYKERSDDPAAAELYRLYSLDENTDVLPKTAPSAISKKEKGETVKTTLTPTQRNDFAREYGQAVQAEVTRLINTPDYKRDSDAEKSKAIKALMDKLFEKQKESIVK